MIKHFCRCGYEYDPANGEPDNGVPPGTPWNKVPRSWTCPYCGLGKNSYYKVVVEGNNPASTSLGSDSSIELGGAIISLFVAGGFLALSYIPAEEFYIWILRMLALFVFIIGVFLFGVWVNSKFNVNINSKTKEILLKISLAVIAILVIIVTMTSCSDTCSSLCSSFGASCNNHTTDYYIDNNDNGRMDEGEYVYSEDSDGTEHYDFDGDGWWDYSN